MKKLPIGIQTFSEIRAGNYAYVDKTGIAVDLITRYKYCFLSRPRRFGKSLFVDTLHNLFEGKKELFEGLAADTAHNWSKKHPVIKISFGGGNFRSMEMVQISIRETLWDNERRLGVSCGISAVSAGFGRLIKAVKEQYGQPVVILIDEYDKPILDNIDQPQIALEVREELKAFYSVIKDNDAHIRFAFLTGVSKFPKVSIFSGINNIEDISLTPEFSAICGYTQKDLETVFSQHLQGADMAQVRLWYDGYHFLGENVYNPFDILLFLRGRKQFKNYWFETGTPSFLIKLLQKQRFFLPQLSNIKAGDELLSSFDVDNITPVPLLFQTGYLAIKEVRQRDTFISYTLGFPNLEVSAAFNSSLVDLFSENAQRNEMQMNMYFALADQDLDQFKTAIHALFAAIPYHNYTNNEIARYEGFYASVIYAWLASSRLCLTVEDCTNKGRIDMSVEMDEIIYLIEFKVDMPQNAALEQIKLKNYHEKYQSKGKKIILIGIGFSSEERNVTEFLWEQVLAHHHTQDTR
ncbi:ATP-binding protein [Desulfobacter vibrioformis]|uniref:ATP-binding protein n=1 Tax=Desulfobacter vibrioformis TaxID=34031 RepID=UPI0005527D6E|nr:ATP-binding protein [Desulfobacter vibrioformis]